MQNLESFVKSQAPDISLTTFAINLVLAAILAYVLGFVYVRFGRSLSNRRIFAQNFVMITATTMVVISVVKSSLALSLGLVGALSIVRFRAAIKEPEELSYLFLCIAIGLGFGADQRPVVLIAFAIIVAIIIAKNLGGAYRQGHNLFVTVASSEPETIKIGTIIEIISGHCRSVVLKRFDESDRSIEALFAVEVEDFAHLEHAKNDLQNLSESLSLTFMDNDRTF